MSEPDDGVLSLFRYPLAEEVRASVVISRRRDLDRDASTGIEDLGNIAWTTGSTAKQNPEVAREALNSLADIAARWLVKEQRPTAEPLPIVYADNDLALIFDWFYSLVVVAHESQQHMQAARVLRASSAPCATGPIQSSGGGLTTTPSG